MKTTAIAILLALISLNSQIAHANIYKKYNYWYGGIKSGLSHFHSTQYSGGNGYVNNDGITYPNKCGFTTFVGYQINPFEALEVGYDWLGNVWHGGKKIRSWYIVHGVHILRKYNYSTVFNRLNIYFGIGCFIWRIYTNEINNYVTTTIANDNTGMSSLFSAGFEYLLPHNWITDIDYQIIPHIGNHNVVGTSPTNHMWSITISKFFCDKYSKFAIMSSFPIVNVKHYSIRAQALFDFDRYILNESAKKSLDLLYHEISVLDLKDKWIVMLGYTDRIGTGEYNHTLAEKRLISVMKYLLSKRFYSPNLNYFVLGTRHPVTKHTCDNIKSHKSLITCLTRDRRVIIIIKGIK